MLALPKQIVQIEIIIRKKVISYGGIAFEGDSVMCSGSPNGKAVTVFICSCPTVDPPAPRCSQMTRRSLNEVKLKCMFKHTTEYMVKTITIREDVYLKIKALKREGESFSDLLEELAENADPLETLRNLRGTMSFEEKEKILSEIYDRRKERRI